MEHILIRNTIIMTLSLLITLGVAFTYYGATNRDATALRMGNEKIGTIIYHGAFEHRERPQ